MKDLTLISVVLSLTTTSVFGQQWSTSQTASRGTHIYTSNGNLGYSIRTATGGGWAWQFMDGDNNSYFHVGYPSGNVGIGTTNPGEKFEIKGNLRVAGPTTGFTHSEIQFYRGSGEKFASIGQGDLNAANSTFDIQHFNGNDIRFLNAGVEQVRILAANGNVGIGTINPLAKLEVREENVLGETVGSSQILSRVTGRAYNIFSRNEWLYRDANGWQWWYSRLHDGISIDYTNETPGQNTKTWWERDPMDNIQSWGHNNQTYMTINQGNVGIGTTSPGAKLDVRGGSLQVVNTSANGYAFIGRSADPGNDSYFYHQISQNYHILGSNKNGTGTQRKLGFAIGGGDTENDIKMTIDNSGNVGIGTVNPGLYRLAVEGKIGAREVNVTTTEWSDYVFNKDYKLRPLSDLQQFIAENHHLPDVPSEKEVLENGQNLGEMNAILLKKVEELTLYVIEQNKSDQVQKRQIEFLVAELEKLKSDR